MEKLQNFLDQVSGLIWDTTLPVPIPILGDIPVIALLLLGTGLYLTIGLAFKPILQIPQAFAMLWKGRNPDERDEGEISPFAALATALSSTVGTGNLAGVATAITIGGPGAIFWMWMTALVGMATKYSESLLAVRFREVNENGDHVGGPMYYIRNGLGKKWNWLAIVFCCGAIGSALGAGNMVQANSIRDAVATNLVVDLGLDTSNWITDVGAFEIHWINVAVGLTLALLAFAVIIGGIKSIGKVASRLVPFMAVAYVLAAIVVLAFNAEGIPAAFGMIFTDAFSGTSVAGGFTGAVIAEAIRMGVSRGLFSNEAGQGSAPIAHAAAKTNDPVMQGRIAMLGTFIDTIVICTMTALVILTVGGEFTVLAKNANTGDVLANAGQTVQYAWQTGESSAALTSLAYSQGIPGGNWIITIALLVFAFTTILGWSYYGERAVTYLFGAKAAMPFRFIWCFVVFLGAIAPLSVVWAIGDIGNAVMAAPNLVALIGLSGVVFAMTRAHDQGKPVLSQHDPDVEGHIKEE